jgi:rhamnose utilization protein RhaD (predicted bifunctional aldolase and dehydrogenase)
MSKPSRQQVLKELLDLSHRLGREERELAILGEGNTSAKLDEERFLVKASGTTLSTLREEDTVECRFEPLLELMDCEGLDDKAVDEALFAARVDATAKKPSVEAVFHAWLLSQPGISFVGHTHPISCGALLCSPKAQEFAGRRLFPDEIVCCGMRSAFVPYTDPGRQLSLAIRDAVQSFFTEEECLPRVILLGNHGVITLGASAGAVEAAMLMCSKAARIFLGAVAAGGPDFLEPAQVSRIAGRPDEHYRQKVLKL